MEVLLDIGRLYVFKETKSHIVFIIKEICKYSYRIEVLYSNMRYDVGNKLDFGSVGEVRSKPLQLEECSNYFIENNELNRLLFPDKEVYENVILELKSTRIDSKTV